MDRMRLCLVLMLFLVALAFSGCEGGAPQEEGKEGDAGAAEPVIDVTEGDAVDESPAATGPGTDEEVTPAEEDQPVAPGESLSEAAAPVEEVVTEESPGGIEVYKAQCMKCHKVTGKDDLGEGAFDLAGVGEKYDHDTMYTKLSEHPPGSDPYTETLSKAEIEAMIEFLLTL